MSAVRVAGSVVLGLLAFGGLVSLPQTLNYADGRDISIVAATIDVAIPLLLAFLAYKLWPRKRRSKAVSPTLSGPIWSSARGFMGALTEQMHRQCGPGLLVGFVDGSFEFRTDHGAIWKFKLTDLTGWRVVTDREWIQKIPGLHPELGWALVLTAGPAMMNPDFWLQPSDRDRWIARLGERGVPGSDFVVS